MRVMGGACLVMLLAIGSRRTAGQEQPPTVAPTPAPTTPWRRDMPITFGPNFFLEKITCPVLSAMVNNGDLVPDNYGYVSRQQVFNAFRRVGITLKTATDTTTGNFGHLPHPQRINIFDMNLPEPARPRRTTSVEHDLSTGIRDGSAPDVVIFQAFEQFIGEDDVWRMDDIEKAIEFFKLNSNDIGSGPGGLEAIKVMFDEFALESSLTKDEMRRLYLEHTYPTAFKLRRDLLVMQANDANPEFRTQSVGQQWMYEVSLDVQEPWTFLGCFQDTPNTNFIDVPGPYHVQDCASLCRLRGSAFFSLRRTSRCYCDGVCLQNQVADRQCNSACTVENGCGSGGRTSIFKIGSPASDGEAQPFPNEPLGGEGFPNILSGARYGNVLSSTLMAAAGLATTFHRVSG